MQSVTKWPFGQWDFWCKKVTIQLEESSSCSNRNPQVWLLSFFGLSFLLDQSCRQSTQRSFIRDPQTSCISTRKLTVKTCSGSCSTTDADQDDDGSESVNEFASVEHTEATRSLWLPESMRRYRRSEKDSKICCRPIKVRHRRIQFQCADGSAYERTVKLVKRCGCTQCVWDRIIWANRWINKIA